MTDYKETLNLPETAFPMKANLSQKEPNIREQWAQSDLYQAIRQSREGCPKYILHDGPPYANGDIHLGHAVNKVLKDIVVKAKTLSGYDCPYVPGWDCHGLPIELRVEKKHGKAGKIGSAVFRDKSRAYAYSQVEKQRQAFMQLGVIGDWSDPYVTMDHAYEANIIRALKEIVDKGYLQKGHKPVNWCLDCGSALAEAEVEYHDKVSRALDVLFAFESTADLKKRTDFALDESIPSYIPIWTTTAWTLPANLAVCIHPTLRYCCVQVQIAGRPAYLWLETNLMSSVLERAELEPEATIGECDGEVLEKLMCQHPFMDRQVPIILGEHVTNDSGTGAVHTAPGHGLDDFVVGQKYDLGLINPVNDRGVFTEEAGQFAGMHVTKSFEPIAQVLKAANALLCIKELNHSYPHCWRHKTPLIFRATPQWFIGMDSHGLREKAVEAIEKVQWVPEWGQARIQGMVEGRPDWCLSRQRIWGSPIPVFIHKDSQELHPNTIELMGRVADKVAEGGINAWYESDIADWLSASEANDYQKVNDNIDVWFDSGVSHYAVLKAKDALAFPADLYLEGSDQYRGWFQSSLLTSVMLNGQAPYKTVLTHGFTVDEHGRKMSKSIGNTIDPIKIVSTLGADMLRLWVAATDYKSEITYSQEIMKRISDGYRRIRNTVRFFLGNLCDFQPERDLLSKNQMLSLDVWAVSMGEKLTKEIKAAYDEFNFHVVYQKIHNFCVNELGGFYLDVIKDRQYTLKKDSLARRSGQTAMYHLLESLTRWMAPILSHTAHEIWPLIPGERSDSVFTQTWHELPESFELSDEDKHFWDMIFSLRHEVNKGLEEQRQAGRIRSGLAAEVNIYCDTGYQEVLSRFGEELRFLLITSTAVVHSLSERSSDAMSTAIDNVYLVIEPSEKEKCVRCWHHHPTVGQVSEHPELCERCVTNVYGEGEHRVYA